MIPKTIEDVALVLFSQKVRLATPDTELPDLVKESFYQAQVFLQEAEKYRQDVASTLHNEDTVLAKIKDLVYKGQRIPAIKEYRAFYGCTLHEAKAGIDKIAAEMKANIDWTYRQNPYPNTTPLGGVQPGVYIGQGQTSQTYTLEQLLGMPVTSKAK